MTSIFISSLLFHLYSSLSYDDFASTFSQSRKNLRWGEIEYFVEYIKNHFPDKEVSILDVGCGNGRFLNSLALWVEDPPRRERVGVRADNSTLPYSYLGIDESTGMIEEARKLHPWHAFQVLDMNHLEKLSNSDNSYDVIVFIASFHHLHTEQERKAVLNKAKKLLKEGGIIMMTNWNLLWETLFAKYEKSHQGGGDFRIKIGTYERYYHGFTVMELEALFVENGYSLLSNQVFEGGKNIVSIATKEKHDMSDINHE